MPSSRGTGLTISGATFNEVSSGNVHVANCHRGSANPNYYEGGNVYKLTNNGMVKGQMYHGGMHDPNYIKECPVLAGVEYAFCNNESFETELRGNNYMGLRSEKARNYGSPSNNYVRSNVSHIENNGTPPSLLSQKSPLKTTHTENTCNYSPYDIADRPSSVASSNDDLDPYSRSAKFSIYGPPQSSYHTGYGGPEPPRSSYDLPRFPISQADDPPPPYANYPSAHSSSSYPANAPYTTAPYDYKYAMNVFRQPK
ncbi:uncharacterized protein LACBIDRAFT_332037 [Laccaria bicolor S238N-H82]|uniref:Predicted protein n=1 Tax=Laccaria bicolor (strain S238N-H82 / ATCC MYA-4686) TaxID=486041 RepID=B0DRD1_LACBS|nr:uncharacterized protein LACBIDRAFT_332037 [Laccaria bicolor S238N-H82]EDR02764.1 predicted protein [Laccaria bicolor S238N-H82]|eukprot:XP_001886474.1 predicted protein [Laccaria bicolor S238N-H82]